MTPEFAAGETTIFWPLETLHSWLEEDGGPMLVALDDHSKITGFILGTFHTTGIATVENLQVLPHCRGNGIGHRLIEEFDLRAMKASISIIRTLFSTKNDPIASLFRKHGYMPLPTTTWLSETERPLTRVTTPIEDFSIIPRRLLDIDVEAINDLVRNEGQYPWGLRKLPEVRTWISNRDCCCVGAICGDVLIGIGLASVHEPTRKATIECLLTGSDDRFGSVLSKIVEFLLGEIRKQRVSYVSAHPESHAIRIVESLTASGLSRKQSFVPYVKHLNRGAPS